MKKLQHKNFTFYLLSFTVLTSLLFYSGCGIVGLVGTPSRYEKVIPAEYTLASHKKQKMLVLVNQPAWLNAKVNLRYYLTEAINKDLIRKVKIPSGNLITYNTLSEFRSRQPNFSLIPPAKVGSALNANLVLLVMIEDYQLHEIAESGYYKGSLNARSLLLDTAAGKRLWPESEGGKSIRVGFEIENRGWEFAVKRLTAACAYCTVRYLYDCPKNKFKIFDDRSDISWESWEK